ncbi:hypothetical protein NQ318_015035 [Aromia moschata]|uniref:Uncharacterized protein n=1 Tax=Aromia moschata TaxID=1265417 RepID=A0AAV8YX57_9CUCU|nr:hypothetical protein NQ318_015035 [Aromia moschata]
MVHDDDGNQKIQKLSKLRKRSAQIDISKTHIQRILAENKFKAFKPKIIHTLEVGDDARRLDFSLEIGARLTVDIHFHKKERYLKHPIHAKEFENYCTETAKLYIKLDPWYPMPSACDALLIHVI